MQIVIDWGVAMSQEVVLKIGGRDLGWVTSDSQPFSSWWQRQRFEHHTLRDGLSVSLFRFDQTGSVDIHEHGTEGRSLALSVCLDGACEMLWDQRVDGARSQLFQAGTSMLSYGPNPGGWARVNQRFGFSTVRVDVALALLHHWFESEPHRFLPEVSGLLQNPSQAEFMLLQPASSRLIAIARALLEARARDGVDRMVFESRTLELMAAFLDGQRLVYPQAQLSEADARHRRAEQNVVLDDASALERVLHLPARGTPRRPGVPAASNLRCSAPARGGGVPASDVSPEPGIVLGRPGAPGRGAAPAQELSADR